MKSGANASNVMTSATRVVRAADVRHAGVTSKLNSRYSTIRATVLNNVPLTLRLFKKRTNALKFRDRVCCT